MSENKDVQKNMAELRDKINALRGVNTKSVSSEEEKPKYTLDDLYKFIDDWCEKKEDK